MTDRHTDHRHDHAHEPREREVIVTERRGGGFGTLIGVVLGLLLLALVGWFAWNLFVGGEGGDAEIIPDNVNVDVDGGGGE